jgi:nucleoredoxin
MSNSATYGDQLQTKEGLKATSEVLAGKRLIGIYFSAHWCPPCRSFTPVLAKAYNDIKAADPNALEIIFVSSDSSKKDFEEYYGSMPWTACLFDFDGKEALGDKHSVRGIPYLVIGKCRLETNVYLRIILRSLSFEKIHMA